MQPRGPKAVACVLDMELMAVISVTAAVGRDSVGVIDVILEDIGVETDGLALWSDLLCMLMDILCDSVEGIDIESVDIDAMLMSLMVDGCVAMVVVSGSYESFATKDSRPSPGPA